MKTRINGTEIFYDVDGSSLKVEGGKMVMKPTIIAIHGGLGFDHAYLKPGLKALTEFAQVVYVDLRGQGRSGRPDLDTCTLEQMADDVATLCDVLGIEHPIVLGHSAGGFVAMHLALRYPELVKGLILCATSASMKPSPDDAAEPAPSLASRADSETLAVAGRIFGGDITAESISTFFEVVGPYYAGPLHMETAREITALSSMDVDMMRHFMHKIAPTYDLVASLGSIVAPTLIMAGSYDWVCPPRAARRIAKGIPNSQLIEYPASGHFMFSEVPGEFVSDVFGFVGAL